MLGRIYPGNWVTPMRAPGSTDRDPVEWMPSYSGATCRYVNEWVAGQTRWRLTADSAEKAALTSLAAGCPNTTLTVTYAY